MRKELLIRLLCIPVLYLIFFFILNSSTVLRPLSSFTGNKTMALSEKVMPLALFRGELHPKKDAYRVMIYNEAEVDKAKAEAQRLRKSTLSLKPPLRFLLDYEVMLVVPLCFLLALFFASPLKAKHLSIGLLASLVILLVLVMIAGMAQSGLQIHAANLGIYSLADFKLNFIQGVTRFLNVGGMVFLVIVLWVVFGIVRIDFSKYSA